VCANFSKTRQLTIITREWQAAYVYIFAINAWRQWKSFFFGRRSHSQNQSPTYASAPLRGKPVFSGLHWPPQLFFHLSENFSDPSSHTSYSYSSSSLDYSKLNFQLVSFNIYLAPNWGSRLWYQTCYGCGPAYSSWDPSRSRGSHSTASEYCISTLFSCCVAFVSCTFHVVWVVCVAGLLVNIHRHLLIRHELNVWCYRNKFEMLRMPVQLMGSQKTKKKLKPIKMPFHWFISI